MKLSGAKCTAVSCVALMVTGCAAQQQTAPEFRLSSTTAVSNPGASMVQRGRAQLDAGLNAMAIESFRAESRANPDNADAYNGLAVAYSRIGRDDLAQRYFETALAKDPANTKAMANLAKLTGDDGRAMQLAALPIAEAAREPIAITSSFVAHTGGAVLDQMPTLLAPPTPDMALATAVAPAPAELVLGRQGVLSARFAIASASTLSARSASKSLTHATPADLPPLPPRRDPVLPSAILNADARTGSTRLERVSLGEVRLITKSAPPVLPAKDKRDFASFGDRLETWLPQSIAVEQSGAMPKLGQRDVLLAAIERAGQRPDSAISDIVPVPDMPEFAYLFFTDTELSAQA